MSGKRSGKKLSARQIAIRKNEIRGNLKSLIEAKGSSNIVYDDLIETYLDLWETEQKLQSDIDENGIRVIKTDGRGQPREEDNTSIQKKQQSAKLRLGILKQLGIDPDKTANPEDEEL